MPTITITPAKIIQRAASEITSLASGTSQLYDPESTGNSPLVNAYIGYKAEAFQTSRRGTASIWYDVPIPGGAKIVSAAFHTYRQRQEVSYRTVFRARRFVEAMGDPDGTPYQYVGAQPSWLYASSLNIDYPSHTFIAPTLGETSVYDGSQTAALLQQLVFQPSWESGSQIELHCDGQLITTPGVRLVTGLVIENANLVVTYTSQPAAILGAPFGEYVADSELGSRSRESWIEPISADGELGDSFRDGRMNPAKPGTVIGSQFATKSRNAVRATGVLGEAAVDRIRFVVQMRLKAGKVTRDVGYMWVPVYLQLPEDGFWSDWPWEFFYADGTHIPHLIRNRVAHQVHAMVYMRPSVTEAQEFFVRIG